MEKIWAPWRKRYILKKKPKGCIFCKMPNARHDKANYIVKRSKYAFSVLNVFPYNNGHLMVVPYRHIARLEELKDEESLDLMNLLRQTCILLNNVLKPEGFNIGINIGSASGAGLASHIHIHIVPRWGSDTNFMPVVADVKVIPESLDSLYKRLKEST